MLSRVFASAGSGSGFGVGAAYAVAVSGGLLEGYTAGRVCTVYEHDQQRSAITIVVEADPANDPGVTASQTCDPKN